MNTIRNILWSTTAVCLLAAVVFVVTNSVVGSTMPIWAILLQLPLPISVGYWLVLGAARRTTWMQARHTQAEAERVSADVA